MARKICTKQSSTCFQKGHNWNSERRFASKKKHEQGGSDPNRRPLKVQIKVLRDITVRIFVKISVKKYPKKNPQD